MKRAPSWWRLLFLWFSSCPSAGEFGKFMKAGNRNFRISFPIGTQKSKPFEWKKPHRLFQLGFLFLILWGLKPAETIPSSPYPHWAKKNPPPCEVNEDGYYLAEGEFSSIEFLLDDQHFFAPVNSQWPERVECTKISQPSQIEEI